MYLHSVIQSCHRSLLYSAHIILFGSINQLSIDVVSKKISSTSNTKWNTNAPATDVAHDLQMAVLDPPEGLFSRKPGSPVSGSWPSNAGEPPMEANKINEGGGWTYREKGPARANAEGECWL